MKFLFLAIFQVIVTTSVSQSLNPNRFILKGLVHGRDTGSIVLRYPGPSGKWIIDTAYLKQGHFKFEGYTSEPVKATLVGNDKIIDFYAVNVVSFFIEPGMQYIDMVEDDYVHAKVTGSSVQQENEIYQFQLDSISKKYKPFEDQLIKAKYEYHNAKSPAEREKAQKKLNEISKNLNPQYPEGVNLGIRFLLDHPNSYVSPQFIYAAANVLTIDSAIALFNTLTPRIQNSGTGKYIADFLRKKGQNAIGKVAYNFKAEDVNGKMITLSQFRGNYVLLDFWASWCIPCIEQFPDTKKLYEQNHSKGFEVLTISIDEDTSAWRRAVEKFRIGMWINVHANNDIANNYPNVINPIPSGILIGPDGTIIWKSNQQEDLEEVLSKKLK